MNFLFVDRILSIDPGKKSIGLKKITVNDAYVGTTSSKAPALFSCVIGEALGQLCSWNVLQTTDFQYRPVGGLVEQITMVDRAYLNDIVHLTADIEKLDTDNHMVSFSGEASVNGNVIFKIKNSVAPMLPLADFNDVAKVKEQFSLLNSDLGLNRPEISVQPYLVQYDKIIHAEPGKEIIAQKYLAPDELYFADHFPKRPVFPLSLLLEYNLQLAHQFIAEQIPDKKIMPAILRKVKIGTFIQPNDLIKTHILLKEITDDMVTVQFRNSIHDKKACLAEAIFTCRH